MAVSAKRWPPHKQKHPESPVLYPFPQYLLLTKPNAKSRWRICFFCGHEEVSTQRIFFKHAITIIRHPKWPEVRRHLYCWELANRPKVDYVIEGVGA